MSFWRTMALVSALLPATQAIAKTSAPPTTAAVTKGPERITSVEGITEYRLANGLTILLFPDPSKPTITVNITYKVGSRHENYGETGMAHLLEHLVFKGTPKHPNIPQELTEHGARPNGTTWWDRTNYFETFRASEENLRWALDLEADRMVNSFIAKKDLDSEMTVVRNEFEAGENQPLEILEERTVATAFLWHNYGKSTIGARSDLENCPIDRLQAFYRNYYQPDNAVLLVAGNFDETKTLDLINSIYGPIPRPTRELPRLYTSEPTQDGERQVILRRVGDIQGLSLVYHIPAGSHPDFAAVDLLSQVLGDTPSGRLHKALVEKGLASSIAGYGYQLNEPGMLVLRAEVRKEASLDIAREEMLKAVAGLATTPPTKDEVERARAKLLKNIELALNQADRVGLQLSEWIGMGDWRLFFLHRDRLRKVTAEDVQRAAATYLKTSNMTMGMFIPTEKPERTEIPARPDVAALLKDYKGEAAVAVGEAFDASPANIESRTRRSQLGNGMKLALLAKKTRGATVVASISLRYGDEKSLGNRAAAASLTGEMLLRGTAKHTREQLRDDFDRLKARVNIFASPGATSISVETTRANLAAVLGLATEALREPSFPADELEQLRREQLAQVEQQRSEPRSVAFTNLQRHIRPYPKGDPRYVSTPDEDVADLKALTLDDIKRFHADFYGASNAEIAIVGDMDEKEAADLAANLFGSWKSPRPFARLVTQHQQVEAINKSFETPDKANAVLAAGFSLKLRDDDPDYPAITIANYMLGGGFLNSRLATRIRQKEGLSYGVGSGLNASSLDQAALFTGSAIYAHENVKRLEAAFREEIARAVKDGFTAEEVAAAKSGWLQSRQVNRAQDASLARQLAGYLFLDRKLDWDAEFEKRVSTLTPEQIGETFRRRFDPALLVVIKAGDFAKSAAAPAPASAPTAK